MAETIGDKWWAQTLGWMVVGGLALIPFLAWDRERKAERGYCFEQGKYLTNAELYDIVVPAFVELQDLKAKLGEPVVRTYSSPKQFFEMNPLCCRQKAKRQTLGNREISMLSTPEARARNKTIPINFIEYRVTNHTDATTLPKMEDRMHYNVNISPCGEHLSIQVKGELSWRLRDSRWIHRDYMNVDF